MYGCACNAVAFNLDLGSPWGRGDPLSEPLASYSIKKKEMDIHARLPLRVRLVRLANLSSKRESKTTSLPESRRSPVPRRAPPGRARAPPTPVRGKGAAPPGRWAGPTPRRGHAPEPNATVRRYLNPFGWTR